MKTLKNSQQEILATVTETTVYLSDLTGKIYKHFPVQHFKSEKFTEEVEFPIDFEAAKKTYDEAVVAKRIEREERERLAEIERQKFELSRQEKFDAWKRGELEAWKIYTVDVPVETFDRNPAYYGSWHKSVFGEIWLATEEEMDSEVDNLIGSWDPEFDDSYNNVQGRISLYRVRMELADREECEDYYDLEKKSDSDGEFIVTDHDPEREEYFAQELPDDCYIVQVSEHVGSFNRHYFLPEYIHRKGDSVYCSWRNNRRLDDYSDLWAEQVFSSIYEIWTKWNGEERCVEVLKNSFSETELREAIGDSDYDVYFQEEEEEEEE